MAKSCGYKFRTSFLKITLLNKVIYIYLKQRWNILFTLFLFVTRDCLDNNLIYVQHRIKSCVLLWSRFFLNLTLIILLFIDKVGDFKFTAIRLCFFLRKLSMLHVDSVEYENRRGSTKVFRTCNSESLIRQNHRGGDLDHKFHNNEQCCLSEPLSWTHRLFFIIWRYSLRFEVVSNF